MRIQPALMEEFEYKIILTFLNPNADMIEYETKL